MSAIVAGIHERDLSLQTEGGVPSPALAGGEGPSRRAVVAGRVLSGLVVAFLLFDATMKVLEVRPALEGTIELGYPPGIIFSLGLLQLACLVVYLVPRTAVLGAVLWTGYLGGAIATHVRVEHPLFSHVLFPLYVAVPLWAGLWLRDRRVRALFDVTRPRAPRG
jgi:DoxX-like family